MRKESSTVQKCKRQMATLGFDSQLAYHRVKLILKIYRDVVWVLSERVEELHEYAWELGAQDADTGLTEVRIRKAFSCRRTPATILQRKKAGTLLARSRRSACPAIKSALMTLLS